MSAMIDSELLSERRLRVLIVLSGIFLGSMTMLNILGITRFVHIGPLQLAVGVLPYPLTFLCTDFISELYGRRRANFVVWVGLALNILVISFMWAGQQLPALEFRTPVQRLRVVDSVTVSDPQTEQAMVDPRTKLPLQQAVVTTADGAIPIRDPALRPVVDPQTGEPVRHPGTGEVITELYDRPTNAPLIAEEELYSRLYLSTTMAVFASMLAYLAAQFCDVFLFHFWKRLTRGKHLWLRNNGSTIVSQLVDSVAVIGVTFGGQYLAGEMSSGQFRGLIWDNYLFKLAVAVLDTLPFYIGVKWLSRYLCIKENGEA
jgi:uncharacterized PurR-regulated membrane protein YhhQ (DUF165 family)